MVAAPAPPAPPFAGEWLPVLDVDPPPRQRRWTIALRLLLVIPHVVVLFFVGIAAFVLTIIGWFAALITGRLPNGIAGFLAGYLAWSTRVDAYTQLMVDHYPPFGFAGQNYPVAIELRQGPLNRLAVLFRIILGIPAYIVMTVFTYGWWAVSFIIWLVVLIMGRMPQPLFESTAAVVRYTMRTSAYMSLLTASYPKRWFGDHAESEPRMSATRPLVLSAGAKVLLVLFIIFGVASAVSAQYQQNNNSNNSAGTTCRHVYCNVAAGSR